MKKKWIALGMITALLCESSVSYAADIQYTTKETPDVYEEIVQEEEINSNRIEGTSVYWNVDSGVLTISTSGSSAVIPDYSFDNLAPWNGNRNSVKEIVIQAGITSIGEYAFYDMTALEKVTIKSNTLTSIGSYAFDSCKNLKEINIPNSLNDLGIYAFARCSSLTKISDQGFVTPDNLKEIPEYAFAQCSGISQVIISQNVQQIDMCAFYGCGGLKSVDFAGNALKVIEEYAFAKSGLETIVIPEKIEKIQEYAFSDCNSLHQVGMKENAALTEIGTGAFNNCTITKFYTMDYGYAYNYARQNFPDAHDTYKYMSNDVKGNYEIKVADSATYTGKAITPAVTVNYVLAGEKILLKQNVDYTLTYKNNVNVGNKAMITITGMNGFYGSMDAAFSIAPCDISKKGKIAAISNQAYTGKALNPAVNVTVDGKTLKKDSDYTVKYSNNVKVGNKAVVTVTGIGNYTGTLEKNFSISDDLSKASITVKKQSYTGKNIKAKVSVKLNGIILKEGTDYKLSYSNNKKIGKNAKVTVKGIGSYGGTVTKTFTIAPPKPKVKVKNSKLTISNYVSGADVYISYTATSGNQKKTGKLLWQAKKYKSKKCVDLSQLVKKYKGYNIKVKITMKAKSIESTASKQVTVK